MHLSKAEWKVMNVVWEHHPACARDVLEHLEGDSDWAYTTVKTFLTRLAEKGALHTEKRGNTLYFTPLLTRAQARKSAVGSLVNKAFDGAFGPLLHFLLDDEQLSEKDRATIEALIREKKNETRGEG